MAPTKSNFWLSSILGIMACLGWVVPRGQAQSTIPNFVLSGSASDILILLDTSQTMNENVPLGSAGATRYEVVQRVLEDMVASNPDIRWGLVSNADTNYVGCQTGTTRIPLGQYARGAATAEAFEEVLGTKDTPGLTCSGDKNLDGGLWASLLEWDRAIRADDDRLCRKKAMIIITGAEGDSVPCYSLDAVSLVDYIYRYAPYAGGAGKIPVYIVGFDLQADSHYYEYDNMAEAGQGEPYYWIINHSDVEPYVATNKGEFKAALARVLNDIVNGTYTGTAPVLSPDAKNLYQAYFEILPEADALAWQGHILDHPLDVNDGSVGSARLDVADWLTTVAPTDRHVYTSSDSSSGAQSLFAFSPTNASLLLPWLELSTALDGTGDKMYRLDKKEAPFGGLDPIVREGNQAGFTLIQLLSSMLLTLTVCALMFAAMNLQRVTVEKTESSARMQEQLQFALQVMVRHLRMAGYGVGYEVAGSALLDGAPALLGCDACGHYDYDPTTQTDLATGTDQIGMIYRGPSTEFALDLEYYQNQPASCGTSSLISEAGTPRRSLPQGSIIVCMDDGDTVYPPFAYAWTLAEDALTGSDETTPETGTGAVLSVMPNDTFEFNSLCPNTLPVHLRCGSTLGSAVGFYVRKNTLWMDDDGDSLLKTGEKTYQLEPDVSGQTNDIPLARDIEDLQLAFCVPGYAEEASTSEGSADDCTTNPNSANWYDPGILSSIPLSSIRAIRITLVAKGAVDVTQKGLASAPPHVENHQPTITSESTPYQRMVQSTIVQLPNLLYPVENETAEETQ